MKLDSIWPSFSALCWQDYLDQCKFLITCSVFCSYRHYHVRRNYMIAPLAVHLRWKRYVLVWSTCTVSCTIVTALLFMSTVQCAVRADIAICASLQHNINASSFNEWIDSIHVYAEILQKEKPYKKGRSIVFNSAKWKGERTPWYKDWSTKNFSPNWVLVYRRNSSVHVPTTLQVYNIGNTYKYTECVFFWNPVLTISNHHVWSPNCLNWAKLVRWICWITTHTMYSSIVKYLK